MKTKITAYKISIDSQGYASDGQYFGVGGRTVYYVDDGDRCDYFRADRRADAIAQATRAFTLFYAMDRLFGIDSSKKE